MNLNRINPKKDTPRHNTFKLQKTERKESISKTARKKGKEGRATQGNERGVATQSSHC